jgi:type IV pilus assembly protein PilE
MKKIAINKKVKAVTLTEVLIVMAIIGIFLLIAFPNLAPLVTKAKSTEAKMQLEHMYRLQNAHFQEFSRYSDDFQKLGFIQETLVTESETGHANYRIEIIETSVTGFKATATSVVDFNKDGNFNTWEINDENNLRETIPD